MHRFTTPSTRSLRIARPQHRRRPAPRSFAPAFRARPRVLGTISGDTLAPPSPADGGGGVVVVAHSATPSQSVSRIDNFIAPALTDPAVASIEYTESVAFVRTRPVSKKTDDVTDVDAHDSSPYEPTAETVLAPDSDPAYESSATIDSTSSSGNSIKRRMSTSSLTKPIRRSYAGMVAGLASTVGLAQAMLLKATYESPPDARGPRSGVERARTLRGNFPSFGNPQQLTFSSAAGHVTRILDGDSTAAAAAEADRVADCSCPDGVHGRNSDPGKRRAVRGATELCVRRSDSSERKILVIGDSLVSGVGGAASFSNTTPDGPALPRHVARYLSEMTENDVHWNALSLTGGDVRMLRKKVVPMLRRERERAEAAGILRKRAVSGADDSPSDVADQMFAAIVVVTGFNDMKKVSPSRTAKKFREDLRTFIEDVRIEVGGDCDVFLPSIPGVHHTPRFHEPLRSILIFLNNLWDAQKIALSRSMHNVHFVGNPPEAAWTNNPSVFFSSLDRIHPSELGYKHWGQRIAKVISEALAKRMDAMAEGAKKAASRASEAASKAGEALTGRAAAAVSGSAAATAASAAPAE